MSTNGWKPRKTETLECPSGQVVQVRRPGPEFTLRAGRIMHSFSKKANKEQLERDRQEAEGMSAEEFGLHTLAKMSDEDLATVMIFARELVCAMLVSPKLVREPRPELDEIGPEDIGDDFWFLFNYAMTGFYNLTVPVANEEVEVADLETFRPESSVPGVGTNSGEIPSTTQLPA